MCFAFFFRLNFSDRPAIFLLYFVFYELYYGGWAVLGWMLLEQSLEIWFKFSNRNICIEAQSLKSLSHHNSFNYLYSNSLINASNSKKIASKLPTEYFPIWNHRERLKTCIDNDGMDIKSISILSSDVLLRSFLSMVIRKKINWKQLNLHCLWISRFLCRRFFLSSHFIILFILLYGYYFMYIFYVDVDVFFLRRDSYAKETHKKWNNVWFP